MAELTALKEMEYPSGTTRKKGETFDCDERHVRVLVAIGRASANAAPAPKEEKSQEAPVREEPAEAVEAPEADEKAMKAETEPKDETSKADADDKPSKKDGSYKTRDMKADKG